MRNVNRKGTTYKSKYLIREVISRLIFVSASEYARYRGIDESSVRYSLKHETLCKGVKIELIDYPAGNFWNTENYRKF